MQLLLAEAKTMYDNVPHKLHLTEPLFQKEAEHFAYDLIHCSEETLSEMLGCSLQIATRNKLRFMRFFDADQPKIPALLAYDGQAYKHLLAESLDGDALVFAANHLWITSFFYGLLRPLDGIRPYRMECKVELPSGKGKKMTEFWKPYLTDCLIESVKTDDGILLHLATDEFQHLFDWKKVCREVRVVRPFFYVRKGSKLGIQAVWAKTCRGAMTRFVLINEITKLEQLNHFCYEGFEFVPDLGDVDHPHFVR